MAEAATSKEVNNGPSGPITLIFVDFDDTIVDTAPRFSGARRQLFDLLGRSGFSAEEAERLHHDEIDPEMREKFGFGPHRLEHSFRETYHRLRAKTGHEHDEQMAEQCAAFGRAVAGPPPTLDGAIDALRALASRYPVAVYTQAGDAAYQMSCIRAAGILDFLPESRVRIAVSKGVEDFREAMRAFDVKDPAGVWMVGNSLRSDVNPALACGANAIFVEAADPWHYDIVEPHSTNYITVSSFADAARFLLG